MSIFSEYLHQLIQNRAISISKLSRDSGVERTAIHKALADERILPYHAVDLLAYHLKLSPKESHIFRQYYKQLFESENIRQARSIIDKIFLRLSDVSTLVPDTRRWFQDSSLSDFFQEKNTYKGYADISRILRFMIVEELKRSEPKMELAVPANVLAIEESIEQLYRSNADMTISHIICFDASGAADEYNLHNLECLGGSLPGCIFSRQQYHVYYYYNDMIQTRYTDPLPYFLVTHKAVVCFSENCQTAIMLKEREQIEYFRTCFYHLKQSCHRLMEYTEKPTPGLKEWNEAGGRDKYCIIMQSPYIRQAQTESYTTIFTRNGISEFLKTGRLYDPLDGSVEFIHKNRRTELLEAFLKSICCNCTRGRMINDMMFALPDNFAIITAVNSCIFVYGRDRYIRIRESNLCHAFHDWSIHFSESDCVFDGEKTEEALTEILYLWQKN